MSKAKIIDKVKLEEIIDDYLTNDVPLSLLTEKYDLTFPQMQLLLNRVRGFSRQTEKMSDMLGSYSKDEYSENYLVIPHEIAEKYPFNSDTQIALFQRLDELKSLLSQNLDRTEIEQEVATQEAKISQYDKKQISNIESFIKELDALENPNTDSIIFIMCKYGITPKTVQELSNLYNQYIQDLEELNNLKERLSKKEEELQKQKSYQREYDNIREELVVRSIKLVNWCIRKFFNNIPIPKDETQMYGIEGLVRAVNGFDYKLNYRFSTYAVPTIVHHIQRYFKELYGMDWKDFIAKESIRYYRRLMRDEDPERITDATPTELADTGLINLSARQIASYDEMLDIIIPVSDVNEPMETDLRPTKRNEMPTSFDDYDAIDDYEDKTSILDDTNLIESYLDRRLRKELLTVVATLTKREEKVIRMRFGFDDGRERTLEEVGWALNVGRERVRQIEAKALRKLRHPSRANKIREYVGRDEITYNYSSSSELSKYEKNSLKLSKLLQTDVTHLGMLTFMNFEGLEWNFEDLDKAVLNLQELCELAEECRYNASKVKDRLWNRKCIGISVSFAKYICEDHDKILNSTTKYINEYIPEERAEKKKRR